MTNSIIMKDWYSHRSMRTPFGKVWNQHLTLKQLEYHNSKQNKGLACEISQNKHMIEISSEVFVVGPTRARSYSTIMYKAVHMTYEASPSRHSQGLFKTLRDHCKTNRGKADHQTSNPNLISCVCRKDILRLLEFPLINSRNFLVMQSGVGDTGDTYIYHPNQQSLDPAVSIRQHITKKPSEIVYLNLRKTSVIQVMAVLPNSPVLGDVEVISPTTA